ncbi:facilitated trehalose transporter Tret1-2 homolog [Myzus persicae]|uniref:facilitated trehalose transporter Tret1-2 homolog n=1 Tax=Myzus persicae TaxID=13164 RepID=UPI000B93584D|nr:facilitated trehalose transporter Tret1-2 homolog [Myzus persicae]
MGLWAGWPSWALIKRPEADTPAEWLSRDDHSWAVASFDLANLMSAWPASLLAEHAGRKGCLLAVGVGLVASFGLLYAPSRWAVFAARSLAGACKSVAYASVPGFMAEISADRARGRLNVIVVMSDSLGMLVALSVGPQIKYEIMNGISLAVGLAFLAAVIRVPETPHYLLAKSRLDDARTALRWYRPRSTTVDNNRRLNKITLAVRDDMRDPGTYRELFTDDGNRVAVLLVVGACFAQRAGGIGCVLAYSTTTMPTHGPVRPGDVAVVLAVVRLVCSVAVVPLIDVYGRRPLLVGSHLALAAITAAYALCLLYIDDRPDNWGPSVCVVLFSMAYSMGAGIVPGALVGEMFPANVKSRAVTVVSVVSSLGSFMMNKAYLPVSDAFGVHVMFFVFCFVNAAWTILAYLFLFETKGMSLSAIQDHLDDYNSSSSSGNEDESKLPSPEARL